jgi:peptidoglycan hydrolase-like protein with peptidoglycan-binding domain
MEDIDKKIDIILRQKLLMGYDPKLNLNENISTTKNLINEQQLLMEAIPIVPILVGAAYVGGFTMTGWGIWNFVDGSGRYVVRNKIEDFFNFCKRNKNPLRVDTTKTKAIAKELWVAFERKGFLGSGIGTDEQGVYNALKKLSNIGEFCSVINQYYNNYAQGGSSLWREIKDELWRTAELEKVEEILSKLYDDAQRQVGQNTSCLVKLIKRRFNTNTIPTTGSLEIVATRNRDIDQHKGIKLMGLYPNANGINWETMDGQIKGVTQCHSNGCVIFQGTNGCQYFIDHCNPSGKGCVRGGGEQGGGGQQQGGGGQQGGGVTRFCPNGFQSPSDGVYKKCSKGEPVKKLQQCLGVTVDGFFGPNTFNALQSQKQVTQFTEQDLAKLCQSNVVVPPVVPPTTTNKFDWLGGEDLSIENF